MRILIDECMDERFRNSLPGHDCQTARYAGLAGLKNGELLTAAETAGFEVFLTVDQGIEYQQNLITRKLAIYHPSRKVESSEGPIAASADLPGSHQIPQTGHGHSH